MPLKVGLRPNTSTQAFATAGTIAIAMDSIPFTITELTLFNISNVSTTASAGLYNDAWDRYISSLNIVRGGISYMGLSDMRALQHMSRYFGPAYRRPSTPGASVGATNFYAPVYMCHFGVAPYKVSPVTRMQYTDRFDLTGGIPPAGKGDLAINGTWGVTASGGSGWGNATTGALRPYMTGVGQLPGEAVSAHLPMAFPNWQMQTQTNLASTTGRGTTQDIPIGDFLHSCLVMVDNNAATTNSSQTNARDNTQLRSWQIWDSVGSREIWSINTTAGDWAVAEMNTQLEDLQGWPPVDDAFGTLGTTTITTYGDAGLLFHNFQQMASRGDPLYGVDLRGLQKSTIQFRFDPVNSTQKVYWLYRKYVKNPDHPANQAAPVPVAA